MQRKPSGFTLIELLIVVAIIAILAAIAVPNFLEAQTRAKVARVKADMRSLVTALESYYVDNNAYANIRLYTDLAGAGVPTGHGQAHGWQTNRGGIHGATGLTTPVSYMTSVSFADPFIRNSGDRDAYGDILLDGIATPYSLNYLLINNFRLGEAGLTEESSSNYLLTSYGPDEQRGPNNWGGIAGPGYSVISNYALNLPEDYDYFEFHQYDPTNGTVSPGDILRFQGR